MSETPLGIEAEALNPTIIRESVTITSRDKKDSTAVEIKTTEGQLADYFGEYTSLLGFNGEEARQFFADNVRFTFDPKEGLAQYNDPAVSQIDNALTRTLLKLKPPQQLGRVVGQKDGKLNMFIDIAQIAKDASKGSKGVGEFQEKVHTVVNHELRHVLQFMTQPDLVQRKSYQLADNQKLLLGAAMGFAASAAVPESLPYTMTSLAALKCFSLIVHGRGIDMERDPIEAQKMDISKLQRRPFNFTASASPEVESSSPTKASNQYLNSWEGK